MRTDRRISHRGLKRRDHGAKRRVLSASRGPDRRSRMAPVVPRTGCGLCLKNNLGLHDCSLSDQIRRAGRNQLHTFAHWRGTGFPARAICPPRGDAYGPETTWSVKMRQFTKGFAALALAAGLALTTAALLERGQNRAAVAASSATARQTCGRRGRLAVVNVVVVAVVSWAWAWSWSWAWAWACVARST